MWSSVCVSCVASVCSFVVEKACGRRRIEPTWVKEWYPLRKWTADGMSPPRVGSKMQDYDHWDALVIGEWPPGRSGPPGVCHTPSLFYLSLYCGTFFPCSVSFLFISCVGVVMSSIFHSGQAIISTRVEKLPAIGSGPAVGFFSSQPFVSSAGRICT